MATTLHYRGDQGTARVYIERMLSRYASAKQQPRVGPLPCRSASDRALLPGAHPVAAGLCRSGAAGGRAQHRGGPGARPRAVVRQRAGAGRVSDRLVHRRPCGGQAARARCCSITRKNMGFASGMSGRDCFIGLLDVPAEATSRGGLQMMRAAFDQAGDSRFLPRYMVLMGEFAAATGQVGRRGARPRDGGRHHRPLRAQRRAVVSAGAAAHQGRPADPARCGRTGRGTFSAGVRPGRCAGRACVAAPLGDQLGPAAARPRQAGGRAQAFVRACWRWFSEGFATSDLRKAEQLLAEL